MKKFIGLALSIILVLSMTAFHAAAEVPAIEKTDRFDVMETESGLYMISHDGELIIIVSDDTEIVFEAGLDARECLADEQTLSELLDGRNLTVSYTIATHSLPPQTTPEKIVILYEIAVHPIYEFTPEEIEELFKTDGENLP
ncbi:MAG: hypothetical protein FWF15_10555, partial [Oscillospiraceae bacterium]|nr:hypothetical protein [Oscillospiraceae bacterium]